MKRSTLLAVSLLASIVLAGAASADASAGTATELAAGPVSVKLQRFGDYRMAVLAGVASGRTVVAVEFVRTRGSAVQATDYVFDVPTTAVVINHGLTRAIVDTASAMGQFGRIRLAFSCRRRHPETAGSPCLGSAHARSGAVSGQLDVRSDLGAVLAKSLPARIVEKRLTLPESVSGASPGAGKPVLGRPNCRQYPHAAVLAEISATNGSSRDFDLTTFLAARPRTGPIAVLAAATRQRLPATEIVEVQAVAPRSALTLTRTHSARFNASGIPFLTGRVSFTRTGPLPGCTHRGATGTAGGSLRAHLDFFGTVPLLAATRAAGGILIGPA